MISKPLQYLAGLTLVIILFAAIHAFANVILPIILSLFIALILHPLVCGIQKLNIPRVLAVCLLLIVLLVMAFLLVVYLGTTINALAKTLPLYRTELTATVRVVSHFMHELGMTISTEELMSYVDPTDAVSMLTRAVSQLSNVIVWIVLIFIITAFMLLETEQFYIKFQQIIPLSKKHPDIITQMVNSITHYLILKTVSSLLTGLCVWGMLVLFEVHFAFVWGVLAFALNFIPNIGSILAAIPPLFQVLMFAGIQDAVMLLTGYILINVLLGNILEPKVFGRRLGLSTLMVFLSLLFWGALLGLIGALLSVPLTIVTKIIFEQFEGTKGIALLLSDTSKNNSAK